ncbi:relaxase/mobilization nuclease domain-containing protein, partial [Priestia megaterium]
HGFERQVTRERETRNSATTVNRGFEENIRRDDFASQSDRGLSLDVPERKYEQRDDDATRARTDQTDEPRRTSGNEIDFADIDQQIRDRHLRAQAIYERNFGRDEDGHQGIEQRDEKKSGVSEQRVPNKQSSDQRRTREDQQQSGEQVRHVEREGEIRTQRNREKQQDYDIER